MLPSPPSTRRLDHAVTPGRGAVESGDSCHASNSLSVSSRQNDEQLGRAGRGLVQVADAVERLATAQVEFVADDDRAGVEAIF